MCDGIARYLGYLRSSCGARSCMLRVVRKKKDKAGEGPCYMPVVRSFRSSKVETMFSVFLRVALVGREVLRLTVLFT